jgi:hypothetical protein
LPASIAERAGSERLDFGKREGDCVIAVCERKSGAQVRRKIIAAKHSIRHRFPPHLRISSWLKLGGKSSSRAAPGGGIVIR